MGKQARNLSRALRQARAAAQERARRRNRLLAAGGGLVILGLVVAIVVSLVNAGGRPEVADGGDRPLVAPAGSTARGRWWWAGHPRPCVSRSSWTTCARSAGGSSGPTAPTSSGSSPTARSGSSRTRCQLLAFHATLFAVYGGALLG